jgi:ATP-dependent protease ClpP protease subunit
MESLVINEQMHLYGDVGDPWGWGDGFTAEQVAKALVELGSGDITVRMNSGGGIATEGMAIYSLLKAHAGKVTIAIDGVAASAASLIAMAGDEIEMRTGAMMMIHDPSGVTRGPAKVHEDAAAFLHKLADNYASVYAQRSGKTTSAVRKLMLATTWMTADEAVGEKFATRQITEQASAMAAFDYRIYAHAPGEMPVRVRDDQTPTAAIAAANLGVFNMFLTASTETKPKSWAAGFYAAVGSTDIELSVLNEIVAASETQEQAKDALIAKLAEKRNSALPSPQSMTPMFKGETLGNPDFLAKTIEEVVFARMSGTSPQGAARELMAKSLLELGAMHALQSRGERISFANPNHVVDRILMAGANSTSDYPGLLVSASNRVLLTAYAAAESELKKIARRRDAADFRKLTMIRLSEAPALKPVGEGAEFTYGSRAESTQSFGLATYGRIFSLTRQALINDDLHAFADAATAFGRAAANCEADLIASLFTANGGNGINLDDNSPIYGTGASRLNKAAAGAALSVASLGDARQAMREQKGLDGITPLNVVPKHLVVGPALETLAEQVLHTLSAVQVSEVNPFANKLTLHVEPRLSDESWRLFADATDLPTIVIGYLSGTNGPDVTHKEGWEVDGLEVKCRLDFGAGIEGAKGTYLNPGE